VKLVEKEKEKEGKEKGKGKKKVEGKGQVPMSSIIDQGSQMFGGSQSKMKKKVVLREFTKNIVTQGTQVIALDNEEETNSKELVLNVSIEDVVDNRGAKLLH